MRVEVKGAGYVEEERRRKRREEEEEGVMSD